MKRGQVTLLVIIGIILLFAVSMMLYFGRITYTDQLQAQARESINEFVESNSLSQYITTCLQRVASEGLELIQEQGGVLYTSQGGLIDLNADVDGNDLGNGDVYLEFFDDNKLRKVSYGIIDIQQDFCIYYHPDAQGNPPGVDGEEAFSVDANINWQYPVPEVSFNKFENSFLGSSQPGCINIQPNENLKKSGYLGYNTLPQLCTREGAESYINLGFGRFVCAAYIEDPNRESVSEELREYPSIERQLETFIEGKFQDCFESDIYEKQGDEITLDEKKVNVEVLFMEPKGILIRSQFPFEISLKGKKPIVQIVDFQQKLNTNLLAKYRFSRALLKEMVRNPNFDFHGGEYKELDWYSPEIQVQLITPESCEFCTPEGCEVTCPPSSLINDDILRITYVDPDTQDQDTPFDIALTQRRPVLDFISDPNQNLQVRDVDFVLDQNQIFTLPIKAMDPNNDSITITFKGWKQTTDSIFDRTCCETRDEGCNLNNYNDCRITPDKFDRLDFATCRTNAACNIRELTELNNDAFNIPPGVVIDEDRPGLLQELYDNNNGLIEFQLDETDIGEHEIIVEVTDEHGAIDFQVIKILVYDTPVPILNAYNDYDDIQNQYASYEDIYFLDGTDSLASAFSDEDISEYFFTTTYGEDNIYNEWQTLEELLTLPEDPFTIQDIPFYNFTKGRFEEIFPGETQGVIQATLRVIQNIDGKPFNSPQTEPIDIYLSECLPHGYDPEIRGDLLDAYGIDAYEEDGEPYYSRYLQTSSVINDLLYLPHVCCEPIPEQILPVTNPVTPSNTNTGDPDDEEIEPILGGGTIADDNELCYLNNIQTCYPPPVTDSRYVRDLLSNPVREADGGLSIVDATTLTNRYPDNAYDLETTRDGFRVLGDSINDIFTLTQEQYCSGNRGNLCSGDIELSWARTQCGNDISDFEPYQFARCEGPGFPDSTSGVYQNYAGSALDSNRPYVGGRFSCQGGDATQRFGIDLSCENYGAGDSFEKDVLGVSAIRDYELGPEIGRSIADGFCAGPRPTDISGTAYPPIVTVVSTGQFECYGKCGVNGCEYDLNNCFCPADDVCGEGNSVQRVQGVSFLDRLDGQIPLFSCNSRNRVACNNACQPSAADTKEDCYCKDPENIYFGIAQKRVTEGRLQEYDGWFGDKSTDWTIANGACCSQAGDYAVTNNPAGEANAAVCFDGNSYASNSLFGSATNERFLALDGKVYYCTDNSGNIPVAFQNAQWVPYVEVIASGQTVTGSSGGRSCTPTGWT